MTIEEAKRLLKSKGHIVISEKKLGNNTGVQLKLESGAIVNVFNNGTVNVQGSRKEQIESVLSISAGSPYTQKIENKVFVAYGHDGAAKTQLEAMLRRWGLEPIILDQLPSEGQTLIEKLESYTSDVQFAVVLATPDDEGNRAGKPDEKAFRARQNVVLELGMMLTKLGRPKVAILLKDQGKMEKPSDIQGLIYIPFQENLEKEAGVLLAKEMVKHGFDIEVKKL